MTFDFAPFVLSGRVYGSLLNHRTALDAVGSVAHKPPYNALPHAPVLFIKPRNTLAVSGTPIEVPVGVYELEVAAMLGVVIGITACRISEARAHEYIAGYTMVNDVSVPQPNYHRPSVRYKARDGFCPMGPRVVARDSIGVPDALTLRTFIDGSLVQEASTSQLVRPIAQLLADVTEFMTLAPGDVLAVGAAAPAPRVHAGQTVSIEGNGLGTLVNPIVTGNE